MTGAAPGCACHGCCDVRLGAVLKAAAARAPSELGPPQLPPPADDTAGMRRQFVLCLLAIVPFTNAWPRPAHADLFGGDVAVLSGILAQSVQTVTQLKSQLDQWDKQIQYTRETLARLNPTSYSDLLALYHETKAARVKLLNDVNAIGYDVDQVNTSFRRMFPKNQQEWRASSVAEAQQRASSWHEELTSASLVAMRVQAGVFDIDRHNARAEEALNASKTGGGEVRQLQAITQMLSVMQQQIGNLVQLLSTGGRVSAGLAASDTAEKMRVQEARRRRGLNYTDMGPPPKRLTRLP
jgi:P-type conjugative transfer protein TrbJ